MKTRFVIPNNVLFILLFFFVTFFIGCSNEELFSIGHSNRILNFNSHIELMNIENESQSAFEKEQFKEAAERFSSRLILNSSFIILLFPLIVIIASVLIMINVRKGQLKIIWNIPMNILYWCVPALGYFLLVAFGLLYSQFSRELGNGFLGMILILLISVIAPLCSYGGMIFLKLSRRKNKQHIIWITPLSIILLYIVLFCFGLRPSHKPLDYAGIIMICKIQCILDYFNCVIIFPVVASMSAKYYTCKENSNNP